MSAEGNSTSYVAEPGPPSTRFAEVRRFDEIDSTNRYLVDEARRGAPEGLVALAAHQTAGRGRLGRRWEAPPGANLLVSVLLAPNLLPDQLHLCSAAAALATAEACRRGASLETDLKWPNDLLVGERKLAGILAESVPTTGPAGEERRAVVVGIGLNVGWPPPDGEPGEPVPPELVGLATSVRRETGASVEPRRLLDLLLSDLEDRLVELADTTGRVRLAQEYRARCATIGRQVVVVQADGDTRGTAVDITPEGHLVVDVGPCFTTVMAGDVVHVRAQG